MRGEDLDRAIGPTPKSFSGKMEQTLFCLKEETKVKRIPMKTVLVFALVAALMCTTACALVYQGLEWYYNTRFTAYQESDPEKYTAIMDNRQTNIPQTATEETDLHIAVDEVSYSADRKLLVLSVTATLTDPDTYELHSMGDLDTDGSYVGDDLEAYAEDEEARSEHWLWTESGYGPVADMIAPGKQLLLLEADSLYADGIRLLSSGDQFMMEDGVFHAVLEFNLADYFYYHQGEDQLENGVLPLTLVYTVTRYTDDDMQLYTGGRNGEIHFNLKIK